MNNYEEKVISLLIEELCKHSNEITSKDGWNMYFKEVPCHRTPAILIDFLIKAVHNNSYSEGFYDGWESSKENYTGADK